MTRRVESRQPLYPVAFSLSMVERCEVRPL